MGRYICKQGKVTNIGKANKVCLVNRCPDLQVRYKLNNKWITLPVVPWKLADIDGRCKGE